MSTSYYLDIATNLSVQEVIQELFRTTDYKEYPPDEDDEIRVDTDDIETMVRNVTDEDYNSSLGIKPTVQLRFGWLARGPEHNRGYEQLIALTVDYLSQTQEDLVLLLQRGIPLLLRRNGELLRNSYEGVWTAEGKALITIPHKVEFIPNI